MEQFRLEIARAISRALSSLAGAAGVHHAVSLKDEISRDMAMLGISSLAEMKRELRVPSRGPI